MPAALVSIQLKICHGISRDHERHLILQSRHITRSSEKVSLTSCAKWGGAPSCMKVMKDNENLSFNAGTTWYCKSVTYHFVVTVQVFQPGSGRGSSKQQELWMMWWKPHQTVTLRTTQCLGDYIGDLFRLLLELFFMHKNASNAHVIIICVNIFSQTFLRLSRLFFSFFCTNLWRTLYI